MKLGHKEQGSYCDLVWPRP